MVSFLFLFLLVCALICLCHNPPPPSIQTRNNNNSLRIHSRLSTIRETKLPPRRPPLRKRKPPSLRPPNRTPSPNQRTTTATPRTDEEDVLRLVTVSAPTTDAVEPAAERRSRRAAEVPATGVRTKTRPRSWRDASTRTRRLHP